MKKKNIVILIITAVVLGLAAVITEHRQHPAAPARMGEKLLKGVNPDSIVKVTLISEKGETTTLQRSDKGWTVAEKQGYPADFDRLQRAVIALDKVKIERALDLTERQKADMHIGKESPRVLFRDKENRLLLEITLGDLRENGNGPYPMPTGRFISTDGGKSVVVISETLYSFDNATPQSWLDRDMFSVAAPDIESITVSGPGRKTVNIKRGTEGTLALDGLKPDEEAETSALSQLENAISFMSFDDIADTTATNIDFGFDKPVIYDAVTKDGLRYTLTIGAKTGDNAGRYVEINVSYEKPQPAGKGDSKENELAQKAAATAKAKAEELNAKFSSRVYIIPTYKTDSMTKQRKELVKAAAKPELTNPAANQPSGTPLANKEAKNAVNVQTVTAVPGTPDKKAGAPDRKSQPTEAKRVKDLKNSAPVDKAGAAPDKK